MRRTIAIALVCTAFGCSSRAAPQSTSTTAASPNATVSTPIDARVAFTVAGPPVALHAPECTPGCAVPYSQHGRATGALTGTVTGAGAVRLLGNTYTGATTFLFRGHVGGCGDGTATIRRREDGDLVAKTLTGTWDIVPGFGTAQLTNLSGTGTIGPATSANGQIASTFRGRVSCARDHVAVGARNASPGSVPVRFRATTSPPPVSVPTCDPERGCVYPTRQHTRYAGSVQGSDIAAGDGMVKAIAGGRFAYAASALGVMTATIRGCGAGTVVVRTLSEFDGRNLTLVWEIVPTFGTRSLARTRGNGTGRGVRRTDGTYVSTLRGRVTCR